MTPQDKCRKLNPEKEDITIEKISIRNVPTKVRDEINKICKQTGMTQGELLALWTTNSFVKRREVHILLPDIVILKDATWTGYKDYIDKKEGER
jgi:hypothetical protein